MTKTVAAFCCVIVVSVCLVQGSRVRRADKYTTKYDNVNLDDILASDRLLNNYIKCLLETGRCTPDGKELRDNLPDALLTECSKCSPKQKEGSDKVIKHLIDHKPTQWMELEKKYDPEGSYRIKYEASMKDTKSPTAERK